MRGPRAARTVGAARGERAAENLDARVGRLDRVVAAGEQVQVAGRCKVASARSEGVLGVSPPSPCQTTTKSVMSARFAAEATLPSACKRFLGGRRWPRFQVAETTAASKPASREMSICACAKLRARWASASSTTPTKSVRRRALFGPGGGGSRSDVVSTGSVALRVVVGVGALVPSLPVPPVVG